jgi:hypothetical protein
MKPMMDILALGKELTSAATTRGWAGIFTVKSTTGRERFNSIIIKIYKVHKVCDLR